MSEQSHGIAAYALASAILIELVRKGALSVDEMKTVYASATKAAQETGDKDAALMLSTTLASLTLLKLTEAGGSSE